MHSDIHVEFDRQVGVLVDAGCPQLMGLSPTSFGELLEPLRTTITTQLKAPTPAHTADAMPWVIALTEAAIPAERLVPLLRLSGSTRPGVVDRNYGDESLADYRPSADLSVPDAQAYVLFDVERGDEFRSVRPRDAVPVITQRGRSPLTVHEGLAFALLNPQSLEPNHCYMLAGSRAAHKRVPALWIADRAPKLGWCWEGNHHTWLGIASAGVGDRPGRDPCRDRR